MANNSHYDSISIGEMGYPVKRSTEVFFVNCLRWRLYHDDKEVMYNTSAPVPALAGVSPGHF